MAMKMNPGSLLIAFACLILTVSPLAVGASPRESCFTDEPVQGWAAGDLDLAVPGASRPLPPEVPGDYELCSDSTGFSAETDHYRYLVGRAVGDFIFEATVLTIDAAGMGGIVARWDARTPAAARVRIAAHATPSGIELRSSIRAANGGIDGVAPAPIPVTLPIWLRIQRSGSGFTTSWSTDGEYYTPHLAADAGGEDLDYDYLVIGAVQASEDSGTQSAVFDAPRFVFPASPRPDPQACVDDFVLAATGGDEIELDGRNLDAVTGVTLAGVPAEIVDRGPRALVLRTNPLPRGANPAASALRNGDIVLESAHGEQPLRTRVVYAGAPFVRGDVNGDGRVAPDDLRRLRLALHNRRQVACIEAADVNSDRRVDAADLKYLRGYLFRSGSPPDAPFPAPGFAPDGGRACGLPEAPVLISVQPELTAGDDRYVRRGRARVREDDVLIVEGRGLPDDPTRAAVRFGSVRTEVLPGSSADRLRLRVLAVPDGGRKCPMVMLDTAEAAPPLGVRSANTRFGVAYAIADDPKRQPHLCPDFAPSRFAAVNLAELRSDGRSLFLPIDRSTWDPEREIEIDINLPLPLISGISRGARTVSFSHYDPASAPDYDTWLTRLAARTNRELAGGRSGDCDCDAEAHPADGGIVIAPCPPVFDWDDPGTCCDPPAPGPGVKLKAPPPPLWGATAIVPIPSDCEGDVSGNPRLFVWCEFEKATRTNLNTGLPQWESYYPQLNVLQGPAGFVNAKPPDDRTIGEKRILFSADVFDAALEKGYLGPCQAAARAYYCFGGTSHQMPRFAPPGRALKTFWLRDEKLPPSLDPDDLYSYVDPDGRRQNLVGMHFSIASQASAVYWTWATLFAPRVVGEELAKDGTPLAWNNACSVGSIADRPVEIQGVWQNYFMCTDRAPGEAKCGNPWGPSDECKVQSCALCHSTIGKVSIPEKTPPSELWMAWLPTFTDYEINACFNQIKDSNDQGNGELYKDLAPEDCQ